MPRIVLNLTRRVGVGRGGTISTMGKPPKYVIGKCCRSVSTLNTKFHIFAPSSLEIKLVRIAGKVTWPGELVTNFSGVGGEGDSFKRYLHESIRTVCILNHSCEKLRALSNWGRELVSTSLPS